MRGIVLKMVAYPTLRQTREEWGTRKIRDGTPPRQRIAPLAGFEPAGGVLGVIGEDQRSTGALDAR